MPELLPEEIQERIDKGWIRSRAWFELLAVKKEVTESTLKQHVEKIKRQKDVYVLKENFQETKKVENPLSQMPNVKEAYSQAVEVEFISKNVETLLTVVMFFAPSAIEILEPQRLEIGLETIQVVMNSVADLIHRYAATGAGGVVVSATK